MKRIDTTNRELNLFGAGKDGFRNGNLALGQLPTEFNADWPNGIQEELLGIIETAGLVASGADLTQLRQAVDIMIRKRVGSVATAAGTVDAITGAFTPAVSALTNGLSLWVRAAGANTVVAPTFKADGTLAKPIVRATGAALIAGDIRGAGHWLYLVYDQPLDKWVLSNPDLPIASNAEVLAGAALNKAVSPAGLASLPKSLTVSGHYMFPGGLILQWGSNVMAASTSLDVTLPIAFPNAFFVALAGSNTDTMTASATPIFGARPLSLSQVKLQNGYTASTILVGWWAVGR